MNRVAVIVHERLGTWSAQLRPRLQDRPIHWIETRSLADLGEVLTGLATPVVVIDPARQVAQGLTVLAEVASRCPGAYILFLGPGSDEDVAMIARELGATHVISGRAFPPEVSEIVDRWVNLAANPPEGTEWSRSLPASEPLGPEDWLEEILPRETTLDARVTGTSAALVVPDAQA